MKKVLITAMAAALPVLMTGCIHYSGSSSDWSDKHHSQSFAHSMIIDENTSQAEAIEACLKFLKSSANSNNNRSFDIVSQKTEVVESKGKLVAECSIKVRS